MDADAHIADLTRRVAELETQIKTEQEIIYELLDSGESTRAKNDQLQKALLTSRQIGTAIGIVMVSRHVPADAAFNALRRVSQNSHVKLRDVAAYVAETGEAPTVLPVDHEPLSDHPVGQENA